MSRAGATRNWTLLAARMARACCTRLALAPLKPGGARALKPGKARARSPAGRARLPPRHAHLPPAPLEPPPRRRMRRRVERGEGGLAQAPRQGDRGQLRVQLHGGAQAQPRVALPCRGAAHGASPFGFQRPPCPGFGQNPGIQFWSCQAVCCGWYRTSSLT